MPQPIRVAIIGLSAAATGSGWATAAHLPYLLKSPYYKITALLNSSVENAQKAIIAYKLGDDTKVYGSPEDLARDPDVDLVVASTRVDKHALVLLPSLVAGQDVFSEWPLDGNFDKVKQILEAAKQGGGRTFVGLQARQSPVVRKVKEIVESGKIGKVLSSTFIGAVGNGGGTEPLALEYLTDRSVGGNLLTIHFGHTIDYIFYALGEPVSVNAMVANQRPKAEIIDKSFDPPKVVRTVAKDTVDQIHLQAELSSGAILTYHVRGGPPMPSSTNTKPGDETLTPTPQGIWRIYGENGEIEVSSSGVMLNVGYPDTKIRLYVHETKKTELVEIPKDGLEEFAGPASNIGRVYERIAEVKGVKSSSIEGDQGTVDFEEAFKRHRLLEAIYKKWDDKAQGWQL